MSRWQVRVLHGPFLPRGQKTAPFGVRMSFGRLGIPPKDKPWWAPFMKPYEILEHTADIGIKAYGKTPQELFINSARGMFDIIADTRRIRPKEQIEIKQEAQSYDELLRLWLQELLYQYSISGVIFKEFSIQSLSPQAIKAIVRGERAPDKIKTEIKAVTYYELEFKKTKDGYKAKVIFDV